MGNYCNIVDLWRHNRFEPSYNYVFDDLGFTFWRLVMTQEELIQWGMDNNIESFITRYRLKILELINSREDKIKARIKKEAEMQDQEQDQGQGQEEKAADSKKEETNKTEENNKQNDPEK